ncbi:MAG: hypothetical protein WC869_06825 [Phycisphaerae bacterium]|jgi:type II secretory pathway pseudopilin PulG
MDRLQQTGTKAFTLVESLMAAVVLTVAITAITMPFAAGARNEETDGRMTLATGLAQEMMEEVLSKPVKDPQGGTAFGPDAGEVTRSRYDDVNDYKTVTEAAGQIADAGGAIIKSPLSSGLSRETTVAYAWLDGQDTSKPADFYRVTVTVKHRGTTLITLSRLICLTL